MLRIVGFFEKNVKDKVKRRVKGKLVDSKKGKA